MADISLIPQNRIKDLSTTFDGCVHTTGNETITGTKTFTDTPIVLKSGSSEMIIKSSTADSTVTPETNYQVGHYVIADKNNRWGGYWYCEKRNDGSVRNSLETRRYLTDGTYRHGAVEVWQNASDQCYCAFGGAGTNLSLSGVDSSTSSNIIPTKGWVNNPATSTNVLHRTGNENFSGVKVHLSNDADTAFNFKDTEADNRKDATAPSTNRLRSFRMLDKNSRIIGDLRSGINTSGATFTQIVCRKYNEDGSSNTNANLELTVDNNLNTYFNFPKCTTKATTTSSAANNRVAVVVQNYKSGTNWYRIWSDGWIEQGGLMSSGTTATVTLHKPFVDTNYSILTTEFQNGSTDTEGVDFVTMIRSKTTTSFSCSTASGRTNHWYAYGY